MTDSPEPTNNLEDQELSALVDGLETAGTGWTPLRFAEACRELSIGESRRWATRAGAAAAATATRLSALLERAIAVDPIDAGVRDFAEFARGRSDATPVLCVRTTQPAGRYLITISQRLLVVMVEILLGAPESSLEARDRELTPLESEVAGAVLQEVLSAHADAWQLAAPGEIEDSLGESRHRVTCRPADAVALLTQTVCISRSSSFAIEGDIQVAAPPSELLTHACRPERPDDRTPPPRSEAIDSSGLEVELVADVETMPIRITDLVGLRPGDLLDTGLELRDGLRIRAREIDGETDPASLEESGWRGIPGRTNGHLGTQLRAK